MPTAASAVARPRARRNVPLIARMLADARAELAWHTTAGAPPAVIARARRRVLDLARWMESAP